MDRGHALLINADPRRLFRPVVAKGRGLGPIDIYGCDAGLARFVQFRVMRRKDMQRIFDDELPKNGQIRPNPFRTRPGAATLTVDWP